METPSTYTDINETGCCAVPNVSEWDEKQITFENKRFIRMYTRSFLYIPLDMSKVMTSIQTMAENAGATPPSNEVMTLSRDLSPWKAEQLYAVSKEVEGADNVLLDGTFVTKVFEGPYKNVKHWYGALDEYTESLGHEIK